MDNLEEQLELDLGDDKKKDKPIIIAFYSDHAGAGKSTVGARCAIELIQKGHAVSCFSFAEPIKNMLSVLIKSFDVPYPRSYDYLYGNNKETPIPELFNETARDLMVSLGTDWGRDLVNKDIWTDRLKQTVEKCYYDYIIIDDLRFLNEYEAIKDLGGYVIKVYGHNTPEVLPDSVAEGNLQPVIPFTSFYNFTEDKKIVNEQCAQLIDKIQRFDNQHEK